MKRLVSILLFCGMTFAANCLAQNELFIKPQEIVPGTKAKDGRTFDIELNNDETFVALQFDLWIPTDITVAKSSFSFSAERFPNEYDDFEEEYIFDHTMTFTKVEDGRYRIVCYNSKANPKPISGNSGCLFNVKYAAAAELSADILPVRITDVVLSINGNSDVKPANNISYLYSSELDYSSLMNIDLTGVDGITTKDVATEARSLMSNPNSLLYLNEGSSAEGLNNVVVGETCENLVLIDGYDFNAVKPFIATSASYSRTLENDGWYSLVLPFAADTEATVERYQSLDLGNNVINFATGSIEADVPCIFQAQAGEVSFTATNTPVAATPAELKDGCMSGFYSALQAGSIEGSLALRADGTGFGTATANATVAPFRCVVNAPAVTQALRLVHNNETDAMEVVRDLQIPHAYTLNGLKSNIQKSGLHIADGKKLITK